MTSISAGCDDRREQPEAVFCSQPIDVDELNPADLGDRVPILKPSIHDTSICIVQPLNTKIEFVEWQQCDDDGEVFMRVESSPQSKRKRYQVSEGEVASASDVQGGQTQSQSTNNCNQPHETELKHGSKRQKYCAGSFAMEDHEFVSHEERVSGNAVSPDSAVLQCPHDIATSEICEEGPLISGMDVLQQNSTGCYTELSGELSKTEDVLFIPFAGTSSKVPSGYVLKEGARGYGCYLIFKTRNSTEMSASSHSKGSIEVIANKCLPNEMHAAKAKPASFFGDIVRNKCRDTGISPPDEIVASTSNISSNHQATCEKHREIKGKGSCQAPASESKKVDKCRFFKVFHYETAKVTPEKKELYPREHFKRYRILSDDAAVVTPLCLAVFDGVSAGGYWSGVLARNTANGIERAMKKDTTCFESKHASLRLLKEAHLKAREKQYQLSDEQERYGKTEVLGASSTAVVLSLVDGSMLDEAVLGDSQWALIRKIQGTYKVVYLSQVTMHLRSRATQQAAPYQLSVRADSLRGIKSGTHSVRTGDLVVAGTDGLFDNLLGRSLRLVPSADGSTLQQSGPDREAIKMMLEKLASKTNGNVKQLGKELARSVDNNLKQLPPSSGEGKPGCKPDDVTICVALISDEAGDTSVCHIPNTKY